MVGVVLVAHGMLGEAVVQTLRGVVGAFDGIEAVVSAPKDGPDVIHDRIAAAVDRVDSGDGVLILTDMLGDTQTNQSEVVARETGAEVVAGANIPMLIKLIEERGRCDLRTLASTLPRYGREHIFWVTDPECGLRRRAGTGRT